MSWTRSIAGWLALSVLAHMAVVATLRGVRWEGTIASSSAPSEMVDVELPPPPEAPPPPAEPPPPEPVVEKKVAPPPRRPRPQRPRPRPPRPAPEPAGGGRPEALTTDADSSWSQQTGQGGSGGGTGRGVGDGAGDGQGTGEAAPKRPAPSLSIWLDPPRLVRRSLITPTTGLLMAVPGYRDVLRSTGIRPFTHLRRLRIRLGGLDPRRLAVAGVHRQGEEAVKTAATRTAATRGLSPTWRSADGVEATTWVDGSDVDRAVAVTDEAFVIAGRRDMPKVLGRRNPRTTVARLSSPGARVVLKLLWQQPERYLPGLSGCGLASLRLAFADTGTDTNLVRISARYDRAPQAAAAAACLGGRNRDTPLSPLMTYLSRATPERGQRTARATLRAGNDALSAVVEGVAWATRRKKH